MAWSAYEAVLLGFWAASEAISWGSRWAAEPLASRLPLTTQLDFEPFHRPSASSPRHVDEQSLMVDGWVRRLFVHVCHLFIFMDQWMSLGDREPFDRALSAELWRVFPPQPSELAIPAVRRRGLF